MKQSQRRSVRGKNIPPRQGVSGMIADVVSLIVGFALLAVIYFVVRVIFFGRK